MKMLKVLVLGFLLAAIAPAQAESGKDASSSFWDKLRGKIEQIVPQKKISATTAVGGVRGSKVAADDVYWKGEKAEHEVTTEELDAFRAAVGLAAAGERDKARAAFGDFLKKHPESQLKGDAEQAVAQLSLN